MAALVKRYGPAAPGNVVKAFGRPKAPHGLEGYALWNDVLQSCGYSLGATEDTFFQELDEAVSKNRPFIESLPRLHGAVRKSDDDDLTVAATYRGKAPGQLLCRFRPLSDTPPEQYRYGIEEDHGFSTDMSSSQQRSFWYQLGWKIAGLPQPIWEPWVEATR